MEVLVSDIVGGARAWANDDHNDNKGALIKPERYLQFLSILYRSVYRRWVRSSLISPEPVDKEFTGPLTRLSGVLAVKGVARGTISGFQGAMFNIQTFLEAVPEVWLRLVQYDGNERPRFYFESAGSLALVENGRDTTVQFVPGVTTTEQVMELIVTDSSYWEVAEYDTDADLNTVLDDIKIISLTEIDGGEVQMSEFVLLDARQRWRQEKKPFTTRFNAAAVAWEGFGAGSNITLKLIPADDSEQKYVVRYHEIPGNITALTQTIEVPEGGDEWLMLKLAEWAMGTEGGASKTLQTQIYNAEAQLGFASGEALRQQLSSGSTPRTDRSMWPLSTVDWVWF